MDTQTIPSQIGKWKIYMDPAMGRTWIGEHTELERATDEGGPVGVSGPTAVSMLVDVVSVEADGDFAGFLAAVGQLADFPEDAAEFGPGDYAGLLLATVTGELPRTPDHELLTRVIEDALVDQMAGG